MTFFKSFWRETGKNTGKWVSNKLFGSGWYTPSRVKVTRDDSAGHKASRAFEAKLREQYLEASSLELGNTAESLSNQLDQLLAAARIARRIHESDNVFLTKARSGITRLKRLKQFDSALHYETELRHLLRRRTFLRFTRFIAVLLGLAALIILYLKSRT